MRQRAMIPPGLSAAPRTRGAGQYAVLRDGGRKVGTHVSEQDFFFDEEPEAKKPAGKDTKPKASSAAAAPEPVTSSSFADQSTTWAVASLVGVVGLLLGAILGFLLGNSVAKTAVPAAPAITAPTGSPSAAPSTLTSDQVNQGLPAGHPDISKPATGSTDATK